VDLGEDLQVSRERTKSKNKYIVGKLELEAMGTEIPKEVVEALNVSEINLQQQLDRPFLLDDSPGEVALHFNKIAQLDIIDRAVSNVQRWIRQLVDNIASEERQLADAKKELIEFDYLEAMERDVEVLEEIDDEIRKSASNMSKLSQIITEISRLSERITAKAQILSLHTSVEKALELLSQVSTTQAKRDQLHQILQGIHTFEEEMLEMQNLLKAEESVKEALQLMDKVRDKRHHKQALEHIVLTIQEIEELLVAEQSKISRMQKRMPKICPFCGQRMPDCAKNQ